MEGWYKFKPCKNPEQPQGSPSNSSDLLCRMRLLEADHDPEGWPAVKMKDISALCDLVAEIAKSVDKAHAMYCCTFCRATDGIGRTCLIDYGQGCGQGNFGKEKCRWHRVCDCDVCSLARELEA
jgi:hypothetical protein